DESPPRGAALKRPRRTRGARPASRRAGTRRRPIRARDRRARAATLPLPRRAPRERPPARAGTRPKERRYPNSCSLPIASTKNKVFSSAMDANAQKKAAAEAALKFVDDDMMVGVGTGSTVNFFIDALATMKARIKGAVASSEASAKRLRDLRIPVVDLNATDGCDVYVDGADEVTEHLMMVKGGGGALTREKIVAQASRKFVCIADA